MPTLLHRILPIMPWLLYPCLVAAQETGNTPSAGVQKAAEQAIHQDALRGHIRFLADDLLEGRAPGSRGDELTQQYVASLLQSYRLRPALDDGSWLQPVPLVGITSHAPETLTVSGDGNQLRLKRHADFVIGSTRAVNEANIEPTEVVFVGYGIIAPEYDWNDYKDADVQDKIVLVMNNDPSDDPELFAGNRRLYYGRWDYKYETAARQGAAGAIIIHTTESAGYPFQVVQTSWSGEGFQLRDTEKPRLVVEGWLTEEASQSLVQLGGHDLNELRHAAQSRDFRSVPLGVSVGISVHNDIREVSTANVLAMLPGRDPELGEEVVVYTAHHDHLGLAAERDERGDYIYNGAVDNASGVAAVLSIADAFSRLPQPPRRSILFAFVGAEEQGLLGSAYLAQNPPVPPGYLAAVINIDGLNIIGPTRDVNFIGYGKSSLDDVVEQVALWQNRYVTPDLFPDRGFYYRSDQFSLAKIGVPGVYLHSGVDVAGKPEGWGRQKMEEWIQNDYHQPSDEYREDWDLKGAISDVQLLFYTGLEVAEQQELPRWKPGDEFEAARQKALDARASP